MVLGYFITALAMPISAGMITVTIGTMIAMISPAVSSELPTGLPEDMSESVEDVSIPISELAS